MQDAHRKGAGGVLELLLQRVYMIGIDVRIAKHMYQLAWSQLAHLLSGVQPHHNALDDPSLKRVCRAVAL